MTLKKMTAGSVFALVMGASSLFAGSVDYLSNQSAKVVSTYARNASTDESADIVAYNPAGSALLKKGLYFDISNQTLLKNYAEDINADFSTTNAVPAYIAAINMLDNVATKKQNAPTIVLPNFYGIYNFGDVGSGKLAAYLQAGIVAGGGSLEWSKGTLGTNMLLSGIFSSKPLTQKLEVSSVYTAIGAGAAYSLFDKVSLSVGGKYVMPKRQILVEGTGYNASVASDQTIKGDYEYSAKGFTPVIGLDVKPIPAMTIGIRFELETKLEFKYKQNKLEASGNTQTVPTSGAGAGVAVTIPVLTAATAILANSHIVDGEKAQYNLPQILALGIEYKINPQFTVMTASNIYFMNKADLGNVYNAGTGLSAGKLNEFFGTGWEVSLGGSLEVIKDLKVNAGYLYTESGAKDSYFNSPYTMLNASANPPLDSYTGSLGAIYALSNLGLDFTVSVSYTKYKDQDFEITAPSGIATAYGGGLNSYVAKGTYKKDVTNIALGVGYKL